MIFAIHDARWGRWAFTQSPDLRLRLLSLAVPSCGRAPAVCAWPRSTLVIRAFHKLPVARPDPWDRRYVLPQAANKTGKSRCHRNRWQRWRPPFPRMRRIRVRLDFAPNATPTPERRAAVRCGLHAICRTPGVFRGALAASAICRRYADHAECPRPSRPPLV